MTQEQKIIRAKLGLLALAKQLGPIRGVGAFGKTPMQTFLDALPLAKEKLMAA